jgi:GNAT superfamily N-acetyltransferase
MANPANPPIIYINTDPRTTLLPYLYRFLPYTLPITRRLEFHFQSPHAHILSTISPSGQPNGGEISANDEHLVAYLDRSRAPETELWIYSSLQTLVPRDAKFEIDPGTQQSSFNWPTGSRERTHAQLLSLLKHIKTLPLPPDFPDTHPPHLVLFGSLHICLLELLKGEKLKAGEGEKVVSGRTAKKWDEESKSWASRSVNSSTNHSRDDITDKSTKDVIPEVEAQSEEAKKYVHGSTDPEGPNAQGHVRGHTVPTMKFLFDPHKPSPQVKPLPEGLEFTTVQESEFALVKSRTAIPRRTRTLRLLGSVGVRTNAGQLIAWAFLGLDGSLTSLHVEPEWRGKGLAKAVTVRLFGLLRGPGSGFEGVAEDMAWNHSDVYLDNVQSASVARSLGGEDGWWVFWGWADLENV